MEINKTPEKRYFFGWENCKWFIKELVKIGSSDTSFFSKKRVESGIAFIVTIWGCIFWLIMKYDVMDTTDFLIWSSVPVAIAGYTVAMIEKARQQKKDEVPKE